ncbi:MAG: uroporphyrinogen-III synthase [Jhaorihella sp.]
MTRPRDDSLRFVAALPPELRGRLAPVYSPLIRIEPRSREIEFGDARAIVFSSRNGVAAAAALTGRRDLPCYCVGEATSAAARAAGWQAQCAGPDARTLLRNFAASPPPFPLVHLRGAHASVDISAELSRAGCAARAQAIYDQLLLPLNDAAKSVLAGPRPVIVPLFSPRTARHFVDVHRGSAPLYLAALSDAVAAPLRAMVHTALETAARPDAEAMIDSIGDLVEQVNRVEGGSGPQ